LHPGFVATRFGDGSGKFIAHALRLGKFFAVSPQKGAETVVYLASSPDVALVSGGYYYKCRLTTPSKEALNDDDAKRLWMKSAELANLQLP
jgi:hypothetical protein